MNSLNKIHELREHLALISTATYLMLRQTEENERIEHYDIVQEQIDAILNIIEDHKAMQPSCPDMMMR